MCECMCEKVCEGVCAHIVYTNMYTHSLIYTSLGHGKICVFVCVHDKQRHPDLTWKCAYFFVCVSDCV